MTTQADALQQAKEALDANHKWHQEYDDHDGYAESELCTQNTAALAAIATVSREAQPVKVYVESRECESCGHAGINDSSDNLAACHNCDWSGPSPVKDHCPGCADENCMGVACPKCGGLYKLMADAELDASPAPDIAQTNQGEKVK